jgi:uncharacterized membrane protein
MFTGLGFLPGANDSMATGVSADGSTVVACGGSGPCEDAFIWDASHGMRGLHQGLLAQGSAIPFDWLTGQGTGISADGKTIVGLGKNPDFQAEAWIARVPEPGTDALLLSGLPGPAVARRRRGGA